MPNVKKDFILDITNYIKENLKKQEDAPGFVLIPTYRTEKQLNGDENILGGIFTNVKSKELLELAIHNAVKSYVHSSNYEKFNIDLFKNDKNQDATQTALLLAGVLVASLDDTDDYVKHLAALIARTKDILGKDREFTFSVLPSDIENGFDSAETNSGMVVTADPDKQVHIFATMILSYCVRNKLDIEDYMNKIFGRVMTADVDITRHDKDD